MKGRSDNILLYDILECRQRIASYIDDVAKADFEMNYLLQDGLVRKLEIIGEATKGLSEDLRDANPDVPWRKMMGIRDRIVHQYFKVDLDIIWQTVTNDIPELEDRPLHPEYGHVWTSGFADRIPMCGG